MANSSDLTELRRYVHFVTNRHFDSALASKMDRSDIVQAVMLRACQRQDDFRGKDDVTFRSWLRRIVLSTIADYSRMFRGASRRIGLESVDPDLQSLKSDETTPSQHAIKTEESDRISRMIATLPIDQQTAFALKFVHGLQIQQIAERMSRTERSVAGLIYRALSSLRQLVGDTHSKHPGAED